jgi:hypothetical protein
LLIGVEKKSSIGPFYRKLALLHGVRICSSLKSDENKPLMELTGIPMIRWSLLIAPSSLKSGHPKDKHIRPVLYVLATTLPHIDMMVEVGNVRSEP